MCTLSLSTYPFVKKKKRLWFFWLCYEYTEGKAIILSGFPAVSDHVTSCQRTASHSKLHTQKRMICIRAPCEVSVVISAVSLSFIMKGYSYAAPGRRVCVCVYLCACWLCSQVRAGEFGSGAGLSGSQLKWLGGLFSRSEFIRLPARRLSVPEEAPRSSSLS